MPRFAAWLVAFVFATGCAYAQSATLPNVGADWIFVGSATDWNGRVAQVYYANDYAITPRDLLVRIALVYSAPQSDPNANVVGSYWGQYFVDRISCDAYSYNWPVNPIYFDDRGTVLPLKHDPGGPEQHAERIPVGSVVEAVFRRACQ